MRSIEICLLVLQFPILGYSMVTHKIAPGWCVVPGIVALISQQIRWFLR